MLDMERPQAATPSGPPWRRLGVGGRMKPPARPDDDGSGGSYDLRNSWQVLAGSLLIPLGVVFILLAWYGAAHARVVQQQIPYLVSGAFAGLGCMVLGGLLYWGHWLYRIYDQNQLQHEEHQRLMHELIRALSGPTAGTGNGAPRAAGPLLGGMEEEVRPEPETEGGPPGPAASGAFLATPNGTMFHVASCPVIAHHPGDLRVLGPAGIAGLSPCKICHPV